MQYSHTLTFRVCIFTFQAAKSVQFCAERRWNPSPSQLQSRRTRKMLRLLRIAPTQQKTRKDADMKELGWFKYCGRKIKAGENDDRPGECFHHARGAGGGPCRGQTLRPPPTSSSEPRKNRSLLHPDVICSPGFVFRGVRRQEIGPLLEPSRLQKL